MCEVIPLTETLKDEMKHAAISTVVHMSKLHSLSVLPAAIKFLGNSSNQAMALFIALSVMFTMGLTMSVSMI